MAQSAPAHILIVDDEAEVRRLLEAGLTAEGYAVSEAADGAGLLAVLDKKRVDLITLDVRLGGEDGFHLAREVRAKNNVPIIMISGKGDMIDRVVGLELGADDYIAKPFHMREVLARVRAVLRRYESQGSESGRAPQAEKGARFEFELVATRSGAARAEDPRWQRLRAHHRGVQSPAAAGRAPGTRAVARRAHGPLEGS